MGEYYDIDLLIGSDCYWNFFTIKTLKGESNTIIATKSKFGWVLNGTAENKIKEGENFTFANKIVHVSHIQTHPINELDLSMKRFWELESIGILDEEKVKTTFVKIKKIVYDVKLPLKKNHPLIHNNFQLCQERLLKMYKKLKNDPKILSQYNEKFEEQKRLE